MSKRFNTLIVYNLHWFSWIALCPFVKNVRGTLNGTIKCNEGKYLNYEFIIKYIKSHPCIICFYGNCLYSFDMRLRHLIVTTDGYYINYEIIMSSAGYFKAMFYAKGRGTASVNASTTSGPLRHYANPLTYVRLLCRCCASFSTSDFPRREKDLS